MISVVPLVRCFRYPRSLDSVFIMSSIGSNFFGKARGACGNLLEKQFPLFLYALILPLSASSRHLYSRVIFNLNYIHGFAETEKNVSYFTEVSSSYQPFAHSNTLISTTEIFPRASFGKFDRSIVFWQYVYITTRTLNFRQ